MFFRIYPLDGEGRYRLPIEVECGAVSSALTEAEGFADRLVGGFDLWQLSRFLGRYQLDGKGRAGPMGGQPGPTDAPV